MKERLTEPTTYLGLAAIIHGLGQLLKINEAPEIASTIEAAATPLASGDYATGAALLIGGIFGVFMSEKGKR